MKFQPKSEKEISEAGLLPVGEYPFEVVEAEDTISKSQNDMVALTIKVYDLEGVGHTVFDWLVDTDKAAYKTRHFAEATGLLPNYETGNLPADVMVGRSGYCKVVVRKDTTGQYPDKNGIADYIKPKAGTAAAASSPKSALPGHKPPMDPDFDQDIPF